MVGLDVSRLVSPWLDTKFSKKKKKKRSHLGRDPWYYGELRSTGISDTSIAVSAAFKTVMSWLRLQLHIPFFKL